MVGFSTHLATTMPKSKADIMREKRMERKSKGLVPVTVYIKPEHCERLEKYVVGRLGGEYSTRRKGT